MLLFALLTAGLILGTFALVGLLSAVRGTPIDAVVASDGPLPPVENPAFRTSMELVSRTPMFAGHHVEVFWNGDQTYGRLWADLRGARSSITLQLYYCEPGRMADELRDILVDRARQGVRVLFLYDAFGTSLPRDYFDALRAGGVRVECFRPLVLRGIRTLQHRAHIRVVCVDGRIGWTGGFGIADKWFGDGRSPGQWRDSNVRFLGPAVDQLRAAFTACWAESTHELLILPVEIPARERDGKVADGVVAGLLHASPSVGSTEAERFFTYAIASARRTLYIANSYFVPDRGIREMLAAAARRGVDTRILTVGPATDVRSTWYAGRAHYEELLRAGVRVFEYAPVMMHAKTLTVDGHFAALGSMNADNRSLSFNEETVLLVADALVAGTVERQFLDDLAFAKEMDLDACRRRGGIERLKELACYSVWRVL